MHLITILLLVVTARAIPLQNDYFTSKAAEPAIENDMKSPTWLHAVTFPLLCYDVVIIVVLCWLWLFGHLAWMNRIENVRRSAGMEMEMQERGGGRQRRMEREMRRAGMI